MRKVLILAALFVLAVVSAGCGMGNCVNVPAGSPFVPQQGLLYSINEGGPTYAFNPAAYPNAQVVYIDPDRYYSLPPGRLIVLFMDPSYPARRAASSASTAEAMDMMNQSGRPLQDYQRSLLDAAEQNRRSVQHMGQTQRQTLGILSGAQQQQNQRR